MQLLKTLLVQKISEEKAIYVLQLNLICMHFIQAFSFNPKVPVVVKVKVEL